MLSSERGRQPRLHYAWVVVGITFLALLVAAGVRAAPGVLIKPLEAEFGWDRASISLAVAISILTFGLGGPVSGGLVDRFGPRRVMFGGMLVVGVGLLPLLVLTELWQFHLFWGLAVGVGTGAVGNVLGATVAHRWFVRHRGIIIGLFGAASSAGQLAFLPAMMALTVSSGWRTAIGLVALANLAVLVPVLILMRDRPESVGLRALGDDGSAASAGHSADNRRTPLRQALRTSDFWLLAGSFCASAATRPTGWSARISFRMPSSMASPRWPPPARSA